MDPVREYVEEVASHDVRATLAWLDDAGFRLAASQGGRRESFGDALLVFSGDAKVRIVRDRGQWDVAVSPAAGGAWFSLAILTAAREGRDWETPAVDFSAGPPRQLPCGISWRHSLPTALEWLKQPGSTEALKQTDARARDRLRRQFGQL
ncbi:hypothetical protein [Micromonospora sp. RTP1Z1]|uniref:hypothetical protein n=1 Tax=Micromonospora sp. RTP1Z1 TaxID=2994043 RepID=UPI0029C6BE19|nr:hypothetical protein [Micromonospora sp. RTP1Z1]